MILYQISLSLLLIGSSFLSGADSNQPQYESYELVQDSVLWGESKFHVLKSAFDTSRKKLNIDGEKKVTYGNVLSTLQPKHPHISYSIYEIWYLIEKETKDSNGHITELRVNIPLASPWQDGVGLNDLTKNQALHYLSQHAPHGLDDMVTTLADKNGWTFFAPSNAVLLCRLRGSCESAQTSSGRELSIFCVSDVFHRSLYSIVNCFCDFRPLSLEDKNKDIDVSGLSESIGIPEELQSKRFNSSPEAIKMLKDHINATYF